MGIRMNVNDDAFQSILGSFIRLGKMLGFTSAPFIQHDRFGSSVYLFGSYTLQVEIDWRDNVLSMYVVNTSNGIIPEGVVRNYLDGTWCRKYIEEVYNTKQPSAKKWSKAKDRHSEESLYDSLEFYMKTISSNPDAISVFVSKMKTLDPIGFGGAKSTGPY
jgi:hypothetical protein